MAKKSSIMKKITPILKDANELKNKERYDDAVSKYREAISFIRLKGKDMEDRELEVDNVTSMINETFSAEIGDVINKSYQLTENKKYSEALNELNNALSISDNISDSDLQDTEKNNIEYAINLVNLKELVEKGKNVNEKGNFDEAIKIFNSALKNANKMNITEIDNEEITTIKNLINQTYSDNTNLIIEQGNQLEQKGQLDSAIKTYLKAIEIADKMFDSKLKSNDINNIQKRLNQLYSEKIKPNVEKGKQLLAQENKDDAIKVLKSASEDLNKMFESELKSNELAVISGLLNPILTERLKLIKDKGIQMIKQESFEESITIVTEAAKTFKEALDITRAMSESSEKNRELEELTSLIDQTCSAGIKVREDKGMELVGNKKYDEAVGEMYSALSIAKNMAYAEDDNKQIDKIKGYVNQIYSAQTNNVLMKGRSLLKQKNYEEARDVFNEAMSIANKMYLSEEMDRSISTIKNLLYQAEMKQVVAVGAVTEEQQKFEEDIENLKEELENVYLITDAERKNERIREIKLQIDTAYSDQISLLVEQGNQLTDKIKFKEAVELIDKALKWIDLIENQTIKKNDLIKLIDVTINYGNLLADNNQFEESFKDFEKALTITEKIHDKNTQNEEIFKIIGYYTRELNNKAQYDIENSDIESAIKYCEKGIELDENFPVSYYNIGNANVKKQEYDVAIDYFKRAIKIDVNYADAWYELGNIYKHLKEIDKAFENYKKATELNPKNANAWLFMASIYHDKKEYIIALDLIKKAAGLDTDIEKELNKFIGNLTKSKFSEKFKNK